MRDRTPDENVEPGAASRGDAAAFGSPELDAPDAQVPTEPAPEPVHRWLDGETVPEADLRQPDAAKHVKFWARVNEETARRRRMPTPQGLDAVIMDKLEPPVRKDD